MRASFSTRSNGPMSIRSKGSSPAISIEQKTTSRSPRSTVGTITEIYDYLRLLYASVGTPHCPNCGRPIARQTAEQIVQRILQLGAGERVTVMAPVVRGRKGEFKDLLDQLDQQGFRARVDGEIVDLSEPPSLDKRKNHTIEAIVDRILLKLPRMLLARVPRPRCPIHGAAKGGKARHAVRLHETLRRKAPRSRGYESTTTGQWPGRSSASPAAKSSSFRPRWPAPIAASTCPKLEPRSFSFNSTFGACPECHGLGSLYDLDPAKVITDWSKPLLDGGLGPGSASQYLIQAHPSGCGTLQDRPQEAL